MPEEQATGRTTSSGGNTSSGRGNGSYGKQVQGKIASLGGLVFTSDRKDQADRFIRARDGVAAFAGTKHGMEYKMLVKHSEVKAFTEPKTPALGASPGELEKYKMELKLFKDEKKEWITNLGIIFLHVRGQCSPSVLSKLESDAEYEFLLRTSAPLPCQPLQIHQ